MSLITIPSGGGAGVIQYGPAVSRPANPGIDGFEYYTTDTHLFYYWNAGSATWVNIPLGGISGVALTSDGTLNIGGSGSAVLTAIRAAISGDITVAAASNAAVVTALRGTGISTSAPTNGQAMMYNSGSGLWTPTSLTGFVQYGTAAARPAIPTWDGYAYFATDTGAFSVYSVGGAAWLAISTLVPTITKIANNTGFSTTSVTAVMLGYGAALTYTPTLSTSVLVRINAQLGTETAVARPTFVPKYADSAVTTAPGNGGAVVGTTWSASVTVQQANVNGTMPTVFEDKITGLTIGHTYWFDWSALTTAGADAAQITNIFAFFTPVN